MFVHHVCAGFFLARLSFFVSALPQDENSPLNSIALNRDCDQGSNNSPEKRTNSRIQGDSAATNVGDDSMRGLQFNPQAWSILLDVGFFSKHRAIMLRQSNPMRLHQRIWVLNKVRSSNLFQERKRKRRSIVDWNPCRYSPQNERYRTFNRWVPSCWRWMGNYRPPFLFIVPRREGIFLLFLEPQLLGGRNMGVYFLASTSTLRASTQREWVALL